MWEVYTQHADTAQLLEDTAEGQLETLYRESMSTLHKHLLTRAGRETLRRLQTERGTACRACTCTPWSSCTLHHKGSQREAAGTQPAEEAGTECACH